MEGARIDGLQEPQALSDATTKGYVDTKVAVVENRVATEGARLDRKINEGDVYKHAQTKNMFRLSPGDFSSTNGINVFEFGKLRDFTLKYHNSGAHVVCSLSGITGRFTVDLGVFKVGKYGLRIEGIIDPARVTSGFDINTNTRLVGPATIKHRYKNKIRPNLIVIDDEIEVTIDGIGVSIEIDMRYMPNKEIAFFISGREGEGSIDPLLIDNIDYYEKVRIPAYASFNKKDRREQIGISHTFASEYPNNPVKNLLADFDHFQRHSNGIFRFDKAHDHGSINLYFPCLVSLTSITFTQKSRKASHGNYMIRCFNEKAGLFMDLVGRVGFAWRGTSAEARLMDNVTRIYEITLISGRTTPDVDILPLQFSTKEALFCK